MQNRRGPTFALVGAVREIGRADGEALLLLLGGPVCVVVTASLCGHAGVRRGVCLAGRGGLAEGERNWDGNPGLAAAERARGRAAASRLAGRAAGAAT